MARTDKSLEPLLNAGAVGGVPGIVIVDDVGVASHRTAITITATAQQVSIGTGKRTIELHNTGSKTVYYGGATVDDTDGGRMFAGDPPKIFANVKSTFSIYLVTATGETSTIRIVEYA